MLAAFVYPNPRRDLATQVAAGLAPDTAMLGQNHLAEHGIDAFVHEPRFRRVPRLSGLRHRVTWNARELTLPWELGDADVAVTPLVNVFPLAARARGRPRVLVLNYGVLTSWRRASRPRRRLLGASLSSASAVACLGAAQRQGLIEEVGLDPTRVLVVESGVDERFFTPAEDNPGGHVLAVGKDLARDYGTLFEAVHALGRSVRVVAEPRNLPDGKAPDEIEVLRGLTWTELRDLYAGAVCVVLPLRHPDVPLGTEGSGVTALLEAMAAGRAVVVSGRPVLDDYAVDGQSCLKVRPEEPGELRAGIERLLRDGDLRRRLADGGRRRVEDRFTSRAYGARLAHAIRAAVA